MPVLGGDGNAPPPGLSLGGIGHQIHYGFLQVNCRPPNIK